MFTFHSCIWIIKSTSLKISTLMGFLCIFPETLQSTVIFNFHILASVGICTSVILLFDISFHISLRAKVLRLEWERMIHAEGQNLKGSQRSSIPSFAIPGLTGTSAWERVRNAESQTSPRHPEAEAASSPNPRDSCALLSLRIIALVLNSPSQIQVVRLNKEPVES